MRAQSGQVGIAVLLIMVVLSTIGISIAARTTQDIQTSRQSQEAVQTFAAAEAALEDVLSRGETYLQENTGGVYSGVQNAEVNYTIDPQSELSVDLLEGAVAEIDVTGVAAGQQVAVEWSETTDCALSPASLIMAIVNDSTGTPISRYVSYGICARGDGFAVTTTPGTQLSRRVVLTLQAGDKSIRLNPIYNDTRVYVAGVGWTLPVQQFAIGSVAQNLLGRETKAVEVKRTNESAPGVMDYALVSGTSILK
jgi:Tfp pilus assembly protein PilX